MRDVDRAAALLASGGHTCVLCRGDTLLVSELRGIAPILDWMAKGVDLKGFSVADRVTGKAVALLYAASGITQAYAVLASQSAVETCSAQGVNLEVIQLVSFIANRSRSGLCPMEAIVATIDDPEIAVHLLRAQQAKLSPAVDC